MPQFELEEVGEGRVSGLRRGRTAEDAVRRAIGPHQDAVVGVAADEDLQGWQEVTLDGRPSGRIRLHQRMRFRRD